MLRLIDWIYRFINGNALIFWACMAANAVGVIWGGWVWYGPQLASSPWWAWFFIPDCPAAALYASIALISMRYGRSIPWFNAFAAFACIKYGLWTLAFWARHWAEVRAFEPLEFMLFVAHIGLTAEGVLIATRMGRVSLPARLAVIGVFALSIWVDYGLGFHPPLTYAVPVGFALWTAIVLTTGLGAALLLMPVVKSERREVWGVRRAGRRA
jgi:uncharacterized membrane protein YpjA